MKLEVIYYGSDSDAGLDTELVVFFRGMGFSLKSSTYDWENSVRKMTFEGSSSDRESCWEFSGGLSDRIREEGTVLISHTPIAELYGPVDAIVALIEDKLSKLESEILAVLREGEMKC